MESQFNSFADFAFQEVQANLKEPKKYKVIMFNDDYTTKDFVVEILEKVFHKSANEAVLLMETVHSTGKAVVGVYTHDIALTRTVLVVQLARKNNFPLRCEIKEEG